MSIVGPDGLPLADKKEETAEEDQVIYEAGGLRMAWPNTPEAALERALKGAKQATFQMAGQVALNRTGNQMVAEVEAKEAAARQNNPFHIEPAASAVFMLLSREIAYRGQIIDFLCEKIGVDKSELPKPPWPDPSDVEKAQDEKAVFDKTLEEVATAPGAEGSN